VSAAASVGACPRALTARRIRALIDPGRIGGTHDRADLLIKSEERYEFGPRSGPEPDNRGIFLLPFLTGLGEGIQRGSLRGRGGDWFEIGGNH
jgi:hypothetical protein